MELFIKNHKELWQKTDFIISVLSGFLFLIGSLVINYFAGIYATERASNAVTDIILDNLPVINTEFIFIQGIFIFLFFVTWLLIKEPKRIPFVLKTIALFVVVRSIFISLTHLGLSPENTFSNYTGIIKIFTFGGDLFFSGHTGLPFLMALVFWRDKYLRYIFIISSVVFGAAVLLGHLHYSIDVFAAFFITDGIFRIAEKLFAKDRQLFLS
ncbi:MAG: phosphatase PAP2-related protein [Candidatus Buchananbacteria bacterium]|nr:phosphatase PAP2-related protein [Candidatus Buchananbacteria bacterium]